MVEFLNKDRAFAEIVEIVRKAESKIVLISPYIKIPTDLLERLKYMDGKNIKTIVVCRGKDLKDKEREDLKQLRNLELHFDEDLHAKCFYNEKSMVITSLNLHEHSQQNNREMGVLLSSEEDSNVFKEAIDEADFIVSRAKRDRKAKITRRTTTKGVCIRCGKSITFNLDAPYCLDCFRVWDKFKDPDYEEEYCHLCGTHNELTTLNKPLCYSCFRRSG